GAFEAALVETLGEASVPPVSANTGAPNAADPASVSARRWARRGLILASIAAALVMAFVGWPALRRLGLRDASSGGVPPGAVRSIAVLPLANLSGDPAQECFAGDVTRAEIRSLRHAAGRPHH